MMGFSCPVIKLIDDALDQAHSLARTMRSLRKSMHECAYCEHFDTCPVAGNIRLAINTALEEITQEWELRE